MASDERWRDLEYLRNAHYQQAADQDRLLTTLAAGGVALTTNLLTRPTASRGIGIFAAIAFLASLSSALIAYRTSQKALSAMVKRVRATSQDDSKEETHLKHTRRLNALAQASLAAGGGLMIWFVAAS